MVGSSIENRGTIVKGTIARNRITGTPEAIVLAMDRRDSSSQRDVAHSHAFRRKAGIRR
jgi:hypothetical protein